MVKKNIPIIIFLTLLLAGVPSAFALMVGISATWDATTAGDNQLDVGSIVQVVAVRSGQNAPPDATDPHYHFQPYGANGYLLETTAWSGNDIVYTGHLTSDDNGGLKFQTYVYLDNVNAYDQIYIRVFSATDFAQGAATDSFWGVSDVKNIESGPGIVDVLSWTGVSVDTNAAISFEVIPEPGTLGLLWSGMFGIGAAGFSCRVRRKEPRFAEKTRGGKP